MPSPKTKTKFTTVASLLLGSVIGFGGRMVLERLRRTEPSDTHVAKTSVYAALDGPSDTVMLGDSLTHWGEWSELFPGKSIANRGIAGDEIRNIFSRLDAVYQLRPKTIFLMMGTNDLYQGADVADVFAQYIQLIENIRAQGITPIIQTTPLAGPHYKDAKAFNLKVDRLNACLQSYALAQGIAFINLNAVMAETADFRIADGIHLNGAAYKRWALAMENHFSSVNPVTMP
jgi:lysophospholipase L1-like esterase